MPTIAELADDAVELTAWAADLNDGTRTWQEWDPDLACDGRQDTAYEEAALAAQNAWQLLERAEWIAACWWRQIADRFAPRVADRWYGRGSK
jgi:hypothetical protein